VFGKDLPVLVMGVDPGLTRCGIGVVIGSPGRAELVSAGVIRTSPDLDISRRLLQIELGLEEWIAAHRPDAIAVERVFAQHNVTTVIGTAQAAGVALLVAARHGIPATQHTRERGQGGYQRVRTSRQGSGRHDGGSDPQARQRTEAGGRRRRGSPGHLSRLAWGGGRTVARGG